MKALLLILMALLAFEGATPDIAYAQRRGSGGFRSSRPSSSFRPRATPTPRPRLAPAPRPRATAPAPMTGRSADRYRATPAPEATTTPRATSPTTTTRTTTPATTGRSSERYAARPATATPRQETPRRVAAPGSRADRALASRARAQGTSFQSRDQAVSAFRQRNATRYTSRFSREPASRPAHIPTSTRVGGRSYNVLYDRSHGGYGYYDTMGRWMMYDAMTDAVMLSVLMNSQGYYYTGMPVYQTTPVRSGPSFWTVLLIFLGAGAVIIVMVMVIRR